MHHAYLYTGALSVLHSLAKDAEAQFQFAGEHNPDVQVHEFEKFGIDEARGLKTAASMRSLSGRALYIVGVSQITTEAQQALLKLFEEPQQGAIFVLLAPHGAIIPTLRSRMLAYPFTPQQNVSQKVLGSASPQPDRFDHRFAGAFLSSSSKARSAEVTKLLKDEDGLRERVRDFLQALEHALYTALRKAKDKKQLAEGLEDIAKVRSYTNDRSPSLKMLLEHLAMTLPTLK
jgi:hypothetical protein